MRKIFQSIKTHIGSWLSGLGLALMSIDLANYAQQIRDAAAQYYPKAGSAIGAVLFLLLLLRTLFVAWKLRQAGVSVPGVNAPTPPKQ